MMKELLIIVIDWIGEYLMRSDIDIDVDVDAWIIIENCMYNHVKYTINCIIMIREILLCININILCEYVCCCYACVNNAMLSHNVNMNMLCRVDGLIW